MSADAPRPDGPRPADAPRVYDFRKPGTFATAQPTYELACPVFFVGFMGAGKTSVARKLARRARVSSIDMDTYLERRHDAKVSDIFATSGEAAFRAMETDVLRELAAGEPRLVSCGGGVVLAEENRALLKEGGFVVHLKVTPDEAAVRISDFSTRPLFSDLARATRIFEERAGLYEEVADVTVDTAGRGTGAIARDVFAQLVEKGVLWQRRSS